MEVPKPQRDQEKFKKFVLKRYMASGEYPEIPVEAYSTEGQVKDMMPGFSKFVSDYTVMRDTVTKGVMIDTTDYIPENQIAGDKIAIMRFSQDKGSSAISGYIVDLRYRWPYIDDRLDEDGYIASAYKQRRYKPEPALGIIVMNRVVNQPEYIGIPEAEEAAVYLQNFVDDARHAARQEQEALIALHGGL